MTTRFKQVLDHQEIADDFARLAAKFPEEAMETLVEVIDLDVGPDTQEQVPRDTSALANTWTGAQESKGARKQQSDGYTALDYGYGTNYAFWVEVIPPGPPKPRKPPTGKGGKVTKRRRKRRKSTKPRTAYHKPPQKWHYLRDPVLMHVDKPPKRLLEKVDKLMLQKGGK